MVEEKVPLFVCAVGIPPQWVVDKLHENGILITVVDEDIYKERPSLVLGTSDKFIQIVRVPETNSLFNSQTGRRPELILQDELHLISGPLGSIAGLFEAAIDMICSKHFPINNNTREIVQLNKAFGKVNYFEIRGEGELRSKWFEAEISEENTAEVQLIKELDIFDTPSVFSKDYGVPQNRQRVLAHIPPFCNPRYPTLAKKGASLILDRRISQTEIHWRDL